MAERTPLLPRDDIVDVAHHVLEMQDESYHVHACEAIVTMQENILDDSRYSQAAAVVCEIMEEFWDDGEQFQPSADEELRTFIQAVVRREVPELSPEELVELTNTIKDFPPVDKIAQLKSHEQANHDLVA